jgi:hypothetical protein
MGLTVDAMPTVSPESIADAGGTVTISFDVEGDPGATHLTTTYSLQPNKPYVFTPGATKTVVRGPAAVPAAGTTISSRVTLKKSPVSGPGQVFVAIDLSIQEVDAKGAPIGDPFPRSVIIDVS